MNKDIFIGIDPGASGGIAIIDTSGSYIPARTNGQTFGVSNAYCFKCPSGGKNMANFLRSELEMISLYSEAKRNILVGIEKVHAMPTDARNSAFKFGMNYGTWIGIIHTHNLKLYHITPQAWTKEYEDRPKGGFNNKTERKRYFKQIAQEQFPSLKVTLNTADALLIAMHLYYHHDLMERESDKYEI